MAVGSRPGLTHNPVLERYYRELLGFLSRLVKDRDTAADLTQESYARVLAAHQGGQPVQNPRALLYQTARNLVIAGSQAEDLKTRLYDPALKALIEQATQ